LMARVRLCPMGEPGELAGVRVAVLPAAVDVASAMQVRDGLVSLLTDGVLVLIADMSATTALSIEGVHSLVLVRAAARRRDGVSAGRATAGCPAVHGLDGN